jgi:hypothetical protein
MVDCSMRPTDIKWLIDIIDYDYPETRAEYRPRIWGYSEPDGLYSLVLAFGNGILLELRAEGDSEYGLELLRSIATTAGRCQRVYPHPEKKAELWLYHEGDECWGQFAGNSEEPFAYIMIDPIPHPEKIAAFKNVETPEKQEGRASSAPTGNSWVTVLKRVIRSAGRSWAFRRRRSRRTESPRPSPPRSTSGSASPSSKTQSHL